MQNEYDYGLTDPETLASFKPESATQGPSYPDSADVSPGFLDYVTDIGTGVGRGLVGFGESLVELADSGVELFGGDLFEGNDLTWKEDLVGENETWVGGLTEGITQFALGFVPAVGVTTKLSKAMKLNKFWSYMMNANVAGAAADFVAFNGHEGRLSDLIEMYPSLQNPISGYLSSKEDDSEWEGRMKNAVEGLMLGPAADLLLKGLKTLKGLTKAVDEGGEKAGRDYLRKNADAMLEQIEDPLTLREARQSLLDLGIEKAEVDAEMRVLVESAKSLGLKPDQYVGLTLKRIERGIVRDPEALQQMADEAFDAPMPVLKEEGENIFDFSKKLNDHLVEKYGEREIVPGSPEWNEAKEWSIAEVRKQLEKGRDGTEWYQRSIENQFHYLSYKHPELANNGHERVIFSTFMSLTSPGRKPVDNMKTAEAWYREYKATGVIPDKNPANGNNWNTVGPKRAVQAGNQFIKVFNSFDSPQEALDFLFTPKPYKEVLEEWARRSGGDVASLHELRGSEIAHYLEGLQGITDGKAINIKNPRHNEQVPPMLMIGPKVGPFNLNQAGFHSYLTADKWYSRSFRRYFGKLFTTDDHATQSKGSVAAIKTLISSNKIGKKDMTELLKQLGVKRGNKLTKKAEKELTRQYKEYLDNGGVENASLSKIFNKIKAKSADIETPTSNLERGYMARFASEVAAELNMEVSAFQANLWYFEQTLWNKAGTGKGVTGDYEDAARELIAASGYRYVEPGGPAAGSKPVTGKSGGNDAGGNAGGTGQAGSSNVQGFQTDAGGTATRSSETESGRARLGTDDGRVRAATTLKRLAADEHWGYTFDPRTGHKIDIEHVPNTYAIALHGDEYRFPRTNGGVADHQQVVDVLTPKLINDTNLFIGGWTKSDEATKEALEEVMDLSTIYHGSLDDAKDFARAHGQEAIWDGTDEIRVWNEDETINKQMAFDYREKNLKEGATPPPHQKDHPLPDEAAIKVDDVLKQEDGDKTLGEIKFEDDGRAIVRIFKDGNVSTVVHEFAHLYRRNLERFSPRMLEDANQAFGVKDGNWTREHDERFARAFERYLADGEAPNDSLKTLFGKFKEWMSNIYEGIQGTAIRHELTPEMKDFFDRMMGKPTREQRVIKVSKKIREKIAARISDELSNQQIDRGDFSDPNWKVMEAVEGIDFNLDKIYADMEAKDVYNIFSEELEKQFKKLNGGTESLQKTTERAYKLLAEDLNVDEKSLKQGYRNLSNNMENLAARLVAGKMILKTQAENLADLGLRIQLGNPSPLEKVQFGLLIEEMAEMEGILKNIQKQAARATSAGRIEITSSLTKAQLNEWVQKAGGDRRIQDAAEQLSLTGGDPRKVRQAIEDAWDKKLRKWLSIHNELWINSLLSGPVTHTVNMLSTFIHGGIRPFEKAIGGVATFNGKMAREGADELIGLIFNLSQTLEAVKMTLSAAKKGNTILDPGNTTIDAAVGAIGNKHSTTDAAEAFINQPKGVLKGEVSFGQALLDFVGNGVRLPGRLLTAGDEFNKQIFYRSNLFAKGLAEARTRGIQGSKARTEFAMNYIKANIDGKGRATDMDSLYYAQETTFTNPLEYGLGQTLQNAANKHPSLRLILPFVRTPTNIIRQLWRHTPVLQFAQKQMRDDLLGKDPRRKAMAIGQMVTGSTLFMTAYVLASSGRITGSGPSDHQKLATLRQTGWQPNSIVTYDDEGNATYTSYMRMDPWASALGIVADIHDVASSADEAEAKDLMLAGMIAFAKNVTNKTYLRGLADTFSAMTAPDRHMKRFMENRAGSYMPNIFNQLNPDDTLREVDGWIQAVKKKTPGFSKTLDPKRNVFGEAITFGGSWPGPLSVVSPFYQSKYKNSPIRQEMVDLQMSLGKPRSEREPGFDLAQIPLSENQSAYDRWLEMVGEIKQDGKGLEEVLNEMIKDPRYQSLPIIPEDGSGLESLRANAINKVVRKFRDAALRKLLKENPELAEMYKRAAVAARRVETIREEMLAQ